MDRRPEHTALQRTILAIASEWSSGHGGLSTFNRDLCRHWAKTYPNDRVFCLLPKASREEQGAALGDSVQLLEAESSPGLTEQARLSLAPRLPGDITPNLILGHGKVTGPAALALQRRFPDSRRIHFIHVAAEEIEPFKDGEAARRGEDKTRLEVDLARDAHLVCAVGPRLARVLGTELHSHGVVVHRFDPGLPNSRPSLKPPPGIQILVLGRAEDDRLKGLDIAARAFARIDATKLESTPWLLVRGAPPGTGDALRDHLRGLASPAPAIRVREYSDDADRIEADIRASSLVLMPSRAEGFGLVAIEAIAASVPVLVSDQSGIGELLAECGGHVSRDHVVPVTSNDEANAVSWAQAIEYVLRDRRAAFQRAQRLRETLEGRLSWRVSLERLVAALPGVTDKVPEEIRKLSSP